MSYSVKAEGILIFKEETDTNQIVWALKELRQIGFTYFLENGEYFLDLDWTEYDEDGIENTLRAIAEFVIEGEFYYTGEDQEVWRYTINSDTYWTKQLGTLTWGNDEEIV